jgi:hypothetical protein
VEEVTTVFPSHDELRKKAHTVKKTENTYSSRSCPDVVTSARLVVIEISVVFRMSIVVLCFFASFLRKILWYSFASI